MYRFDNPLGAIGRAAACAACMALAFPEPAFADPGKDSNASALKRNKKKSRVRALPVRCMPEEYCDLDLDTGKCLPNSNALGKKVECALQRDE